MKKFYENPEMEIVAFEIEDVIATSNTEETWAKPTYGNEFNGNWDEIPDSGSEW